VARTPSKDRTLKSWLMPGNSEVSGAWVGGGEHRMFLVQVGCWSDLKARRPCLAARRLFADWGRRKVWSQSANGPGVVDSEKGNQIKGIGVQKLRRWVV